MPSLLEHVSKSYKIDKTPQHQPSSKLMHVLCHLSHDVFCCADPWWQTTCKIKTPVPWSSDPWAPDHANSACTRHPKQTKLHTKAPRLGIAAIFRTTCEFQHLTHSNTHTHTKKKNTHIFLNLYVNNPSHPWGGEFTQHCSAALGQWLEPRDGESWLKYWPEREMMKHVTWNTSKKETGEKHVKTISQT